MICSSGVACCLYAIPRGSDDGTHTKKEVPTKVDPSHVVMLHNQDTKGPSYVILSFVSFKVDY